MSTYLEPVTQGPWTEPGAYLQGAYIDAVSSAGGLAVLLPPQPGRGVEARRVVSRLDALVLAGGRDVGPCRYGHEPHPRTDSPDDQRDRWEIDLLGAALEHDLPVLGICRGAQLLNVALGGTLAQHLPDTLGGVDTHRCGPGQFTPNTVTTIPGTTIASILGESATVACSHHQAIEHVAEGLVVSARTSDGVVEAVEHPASRFTLAVQWHPEATPDDRRLMAALVDACRP